MKLNGILATMMLAAAALACNFPSLANQPSVNTSSVFEDNFDGSDQNWGIRSDADSAVEYADGGLRLNVIKDLYFIWSSPNQENYSDVHVEVTAKNNSTDANAAFGIICDLGVPNTNMYYFAVTGNGQYVIAKAAAGIDDVFLTNDNKWGDSDLIAKNAQSYRLGADCGTGTLALYVDGKQVASVQDATYTSGKVALFAWSDKQASGADVTFDDFVITKLK